MRRRVGLSGRHDRTPTASMQLPRTLLLPLCAALTAAAYGLMLFTDWGNPYRAGDAVGPMVLEAVVVLGAFACWEVFRTEKATPARAVAAASGLPLVLFAVLALWFGLKRYLA
jgi:hypothetical protein